MTSSRSPTALFLVLACVGVLSWAAREARDRRLVLVGNPGWVTADEDSLYHVRRVDRALTEGTVAGTDDYLNHPHGSPIPWPPYYTRVLATVLGPFAPADIDDTVGVLERRAWLERTVASVPLVLGVLTTLLAALAGRALGGNLGAALAGCYHALCTASIVYSKSGNGDHHAWVSLLAGVLLVGLTLVIRGGVLRDARRAALAGAALGAVAGLLIGSWVGALLYAIQVQLVLAWLIFVQGREPRPGLAPFGLAFHAAALLVLLPAVLASPWKDEYPWMVVNLSWFHPTFALVGALVFVPLFGLRSRGALRAYPWIVGGALVIVGIGLAAVDGGPGRGIRAGFDWVSRQNEFMAQVGESRPLFGPGRWGDLTDALGYGVFLLPLIVVAMASTALRSTWCALIPWVVSLPLLSLQAVRQARFADALALPLAVALAWGVARVLEPRLPWLARLPVTLALVLGLSVAGLCNWDSSARSIEGWRTGEVAAQRKEDPATLGARTACDWLRARGKSAEDDAVLAIWSWGHVIEWAADRPSIATNFGSYVGVDSFRDPCRFLMFEDPARAEALLEERRARWVLVTSDLPNYLNLLIDVAVPERRERYVDAVRPPPNVEPGWFRTIGARLLFDGEVFHPGGRAPEGEPARPLNFLRVVHVSPLRDPDRRLRSATDVSPAAFLWERVPGARVEARGRPGEVLALHIRVRFAKAKRALTWSDNAEADANGVARLRVPYSTLDPNGDGWVPSDGATWSFGGRGGPLAISERAVLEGETVRLE